MASAIKSRAANTSINRNYSRLVDILSTETESWAVKFKSKSMIGASSFEKATHTTAFITSSNKAITMLQDIERYIKLGSSGIFSSLVTMVYQKEVNAGTHLDSESSLTRKLIDVYKCFGGGEEIDAALDDVGIPPIAPEPRPQNDCGPISSPNQPEGVQCGDERGRGEGDSMDRAARISEPLLRGEVNGPQLEGVASEGLRNRQPSHPSSTTLERAVKQGKGKAKTTKPDTSSNVHNPQNLPTHPKLEAFLKAPHRLIQVVIVALIVSVVLVCIPVLIGVGYGSQGGHSGSHGQFFSEEKSEDAQKTPCGRIEVDYLKNQPLMRVLEEKFFSHIEGAWRLVGNSLNMPSHLLDIQQDSETPVKDKLREVIVFWLKGNGRSPHNLGTLANAFRKAHFPLLAEELLKDSTLCISGAV